MNSRHILSALLLAGLTGAPITGASAERVNQNSAKAKAALEACSDSGSAVIESGGVTSCITGGGHGIVCGGTPGAIAEHPDLKGTCDTFRRAPKNPWGITAGELARVNVVKPTKPVKRPKS
jgi:hypothetical protein